MKFKVGDKVKVREDLKDGERYGEEVFVDSMKNCRGKVLEIVSIRDKRWYKLRGSNYYWTDEMFEGLENSDKPEASDPVNHPSHYTDGKIEVIDFIEDKKLGFCLGNAAKYISRAGKKDPSKRIEDLEKAIWYIKRQIKAWTA